MFNLPLAERFEHRVKASIGSQWEAPDRGLTAAGYSGILFTRVETCGSVRVKREGSAGLGARVLSYWTKARSTRRRFCRRPFQMTLPATFD